MPTGALLDACARQARAVCYTAREAPARALHPQVNGAAEGYVSESANRQSR